MTTQENPKVVSSQEQLKNERYLWIARAFSVVAILSIVANMLLLFAIGSLVPLVRVRPYFLTILDKNQQVVEITPVQNEKLNSDVIKSLIRQYVLARYTVTPDLDELTERWGANGIVYQMSSQEVYRGFEENHWGEEMRKRIEKNGMVSNVKITSIVRQGENSSWWNVSFKWLRQDQTSVEPEIIEMMDQLEVRFDPLFNQANISTWQDILKNPLGFRVLNYGTTK